MKTRFVSSLRAFAPILVLAASIGLSAVACDDESSPDDGSGPTAPSELAFEGSVELFPAFNYDTGLLPAGSPVQASFQVAATGNATISAKAAPSGSAGAPTISGLPGTGKVGIAGGFALLGNLKVDVSGFTYDGPIPGIENVEIPITGDKPFDPFALGQPVGARADIPPADLPPIPLPAGIPGSLVLSIAEGSFVEITFTGTCAGAAGTEARYVGDLVRAGSLVIKPSVVIDIPIIGEKVYEIPSFTVDLALGTSAVDIPATIAAFGAPAAGDAQSSSCEAPTSTGLDTSMTTGTGTGTGTETGATGTETGATGTGTGSNTGTGTGSNTGTGTGTTNPPADWDCAPQYYDEASQGATVYCDCSCGAHDPDCDAAFEAVGCGNEGVQGTACVDDVCSPPPEGWTCDAAYYDEEGQGAAIPICDCNCGVLDPDCSASDSFPVEGCSPGQTCGGIEGVCM